MGGSADVTWGVGFAVITLHPITAVGVAALSVGAGVVVDSAGGCGAQAVRDSRKKEQAKSVVRSIQFPSRKYNAPTSENCSIFPQLA